ncbi:(2,3-dihydroxybenzoyl)adenylate synthase [Pseudomonas sp. PA27(2017)]|uniref:(2,3-dihydroxybenzoyl)adenylate synthase n=1 Tax=Pseudomonas sp. PA27(2017) TaxID=1932112 RepID=UPI0009668405|nr:AMP-binding protein [Pseudomonas sp. PA27(2017)]OLU33792.1 2,3-dihydroxybenzoate-AMP ligase [Pseudomonas sp. PA27(2017)]
MLEGCNDWPSDFIQRYQGAGYWAGKPLHSVLSDQAQQTPNREALIDGPRRWTYAQLEQQAHTLAAGLASLGIVAGQRVLVQLPNIAEFFSVTFALLRLGAIPVFVLPAHRENELLHLAQISDAVAYITVDTWLGFDYRPLARRLRDQVKGIRQIVAVGQAEEFTALQDCLNLSSTAPTLPPSPREVAVLLLSGGTTGLPKLIPRTHDDYLCNARRAAQAAGFDAQTRYLAALPVAHNFPLASPGALGTFSVGGTVVLCPEPSPDTAFELIERERITHTALIPPLVLLWLEAREWDARDLSSLQWLQVGGSRLKAETAARIQPLLGCNLQQVYGMAEGLLCFTPLDANQAEVFQTQGVPLTADDEVRLVDIEDRDVAPGEVGELLVRGPYTIRGYYRAEEHNQRAFSDDGYYRSGDLVRRLASGLLVVEGRIKDVINRGGEKIPVEEIENLLLAHPSIGDVALVGLPDELLGERSCACVLPRVGQTLDLPSINGFLSQQGVASYKLPDRLLLLRHFPQTSLGKINRKALAEQVAAS